MAYYVNKSFEPEMKVKIFSKTFVGRVMSLVFSTVLIIAFLPRSDRLLISCLHSPSAVILESKKRKYVTASNSSPSISDEVMGSDGLP